METVFQSFLLEGKPVDFKQYGSGHINRTFRVTCDNGKKYTFQKINTYAFRHPEQLIENIDAVTHFITEKTHGKQKTIQLLTSKIGKKYFIDEQNDFWRAYEFIDGGLCLDMPRSTEDFYQAAIAFGSFQDILSDFPADTLYETIPHFHDTVDRFRQLRESVEKDAVGRVKDVQAELSFLFDHEYELCTLCRLLDAGQLPLRVTHNDTKLNNVLLDEKTGKAKCVLDLDTVMPGLSACDFGDAIRFGASTAAEDETDLSKVSLDLEMYRAYLRGYLQSCGHSLTEKEIEVLPLSVKVLTGELATRFLKDHIDGDVYFAIHRDNHNLDRARTQIELVKDMERKWDEMQKILHEVVSETL